MKKKVINILKRSIPLAAVGVTAVLIKRKIR